MQEIDFTLIDLFWSNNYSFSKYDFLFFGMEMISNHEFFPADK